MEKFNGKYRIPSARWAAWNYGSNGAYFVTICTANHAHYFGKITNNEMVPTPLGQAAVDFWNEIPAHFPFVVLDAFVVMPNQVHGIIIIDKSADTVETHPEMASGQAILRLDYPKRTLKTPITTSGQVAS